MVLHNLMWRNTKLSIAEEYEVPGVVDDIQLLGASSPFASFSSAPCHFLSPLIALILEFHAIELALYKDAEIRGDEVRQRQLCCSPQLSIKDKKRFGEDEITLEVE